MELKDFANKVNLLLLNIFIFTIILDPGNILKIKMFLFFSVLLFNFKILLKEIKYCMFILVFITYYYLIGLLDRDYKDFTIAVTIIQPAMMFLMVPIFKKYFDVVSKSLISSTLIMSYFSVCSYLFLNFLSLDKKYFEVLVEGNNLIISKRKFGDFIINTFYYKTISASIFSFYYFIEKAIIYKKEGKIKNIINIIIIYLSFLFSSARANFLFSLLGIFFFMKKLKRRKTLLFLSSLVIFVVIIFNLEKIISAFSFLFDTKEQSNKVKINEIKTYINIFSDFKIFIFGQGLGTIFFSFARNEWVRFTELTYLEIIRLFGMPFFFILSLTFFNILRSKKIKKDNPIVISFLIFLLIGGTNPLLINSTGTLLISYFLAYLKNLKYKNRKVNLERKLNI